MPTCRSVSSEWIKSPTFRGKIEVLFTRLVHEYPDLQCRRKQARGVLRGACRGRHGRSPYQELLPYFPHGTTDIQPGSKTAVYCKKYAEDGMVDVRYKRCSHDSGARVPSFNVEGSKKAPYCRQNAEDGMVGVRSRRYAHDLCTERPTPNVEGSKMATCRKEHA